MLQQGRRLLLLHETDETRAGVAFEHFFSADQTPASLLTLKVYGEVAIAMNAPPYRTVSLGLLDCALHAGRGKAGRAHGPGSAGGRMAVQGLPRLPMREGQHVEGLVTARLRGVPCGAGRSAWCGAPARRRAGRAAARGLND